ncbi:MAG: glycosyltransferase [Bacteroidales bacterium]|nr:glycosyltransferase [Bacteroidales bacterium]
MRIFVLLSRIPWPLEKGDKLRAFNQIKSLAQNNEIFLCALNDDKSVDKKEAAVRLMPYCKSIEFIDISKWSVLWNMGAAFFRGLPLQCGYFYNRAAHKKIHNLIKQIKPDMLYGQLVRVAPYLHKEDVLKTIDYQDVLSMGMKRRMEKVSFLKRQIFKMEYKRLLRYEHEVFDSFTIKTIISDSDRQLIDHCKKNDILIIPNGVDFEYYKKIASEKNYDVVFTGNMAYPPNIDAVKFLALEIMPLVWAKRPETSLCIAGATPDPSVKALKSEKIIVTGWVDDMREIYSKSKIFIAPMRIGTGLQNKLLEAMAMELPCITSPLANGSLQAEKNTEVLVSESAEDFANSILQLLDDSQMAAQLARKGNLFVKNKYDWNSTTSVLEKAMNEVVVNQK